MEETKRYMVDGELLTVEQCLALFRNGVLDDRQEKCLRWVEGDVVLDIGCYAGGFVKEIAERYPDKTVIGIDYYEDNIAIARLRFPAIADSFRHMSVYGLDLEDESVDCITLQEVIEHLEGAAQAIKEISRVLKTGGCLIVSTPNAYAIGDMLRFFRLETHNVIRAFLGRSARLYSCIFFDNVEWNRHIYCWTPATLLTLLEVNGFEYVGHAYCNNLKNPLGRLFLWFFPFLGAIQILKVKKIAMASTRLV